ncbi:MAG: Bug family tripartite tricarboxylate transporter substrate binding protein [Burkholderiaceae bacterium]
MSLPRSQPPHLPRRRFAMGALGAAVATAAPPGFAQAAWPSRPIRIVAATAPGGAIDATARAYGDHITQRTGASIIVESRPGGHSMIAADQVARAAPDGYTFLFAVNSALTQAPILLKQAPVQDPAKAFDMLAGFHPGPALFLVKRDLPVQRLRDFVERARQERTLIGSIGVGSRAHMIGAQMNALLGTKIDVIHYKGAGPALQDLAGGQIDCTVGSYTGAHPFIQQGRMRPIAIASGARTPKLPDVPTFADEGFPQPVFRLRDWLTLAAPAGTPRAVMQQMAQLLQEATSTPAVVRARDAMAVSEAPLLLDEFEQALAQERPVWQSATRALGVTLE